MGERKRKANEGGAKPPVPVVAEPPVRAAA